MKRPHRYGSGVLFLLISRSVKTQYLQVWIQSPFSAECRIMSHLSVMLESIASKEPAKAAGKEQKQGTTQTKTAMVEFNTEPECAYFLAKFHEQTASAIGPGPLQVRSL